MTKEHIDTEHYTRKHEMLLAFDKKKKQAWIAMVLLFLIGVTGAHRFYLGHYKIGAGILIGEVVFLVTMIMGFEASVLTWVFMAYGIFILIEFFRLTNITDKENERLRKTLRREYGLT